MTTGPGSHSPVGASSIKRVLACPASVSLAQGIEDEESDHAALGTAVHSVIEECFRRNMDAWQMIGSKTVEEYPIDKQMANAAQVMLDAVRKAHPDRNQGNFWVERRFHCPTIHPLFFGTSDVVCLEGPERLVGPGSDTLLHVWDYKNGAGVVIEVDENPQLMYYACGALEDLDLWNKVDRVVLHVVQPNGFHHDGPVREWSTTPAHLVTWMEDVLVPGIEIAVRGDGNLTDVDRPMRSGEHCRFCPARTHACPQLMSDMDELEALMKETETKGADALTGEQLARFLALKEIGKIVFKAAESTAFKRIQGGARVEGYKLVPARAFRQWKDGADAAAQAEFGAAAMTEPKAKSPAMIDDLPLGTAFTSRWAFKPDAGLTLVKGDDNRPEVSTDTKSLFTAITAKAPPLEPKPIVPPPANGGRRKPSTSINTVH